MKLTIEGFENGAEIPVDFTCDGEGRIFDIKISELPDGTASVAIIIDDPDAPRGVYTHFVAWNIPVKDSVADCSELENVSSLGINSSGQKTFVPPCPPSGRHRYFIKTYALDKVLSLEQGARSELEKEMKGHIIKSAEIFGVYSR